MEIPQKTLCAFVKQCIRAQLTIAKNVRAVQNRPYVLFDKSFEKVSIVRIKSYRIQVDAHGRYGVLSEASQKTLTYEQFLEILSTIDDVLPFEDLSFDGNSVVLKSVPKEVFSPL